MMSCSYLYMSKLAFLQDVYSLKNVKHLVLDEADTLLDDSFSFNVLDLLKDLKVGDACVTTFC